nr:MAG TPA: hypothetical protein [Caudoviricetes sp.]
MTTGEIVKALRETESRSKRELLDEAARVIKELACTTAVLTAVLEVIEEEKLDEQERKELHAEIHAGLKHTMNVITEKWK